MSERRLVDLSLAEFVEAVASTDQPAPAAGSVSALTGAACAALLELVCGVRGMGERIETARELRRELLALLDEDAAAVAAWLKAPNEVQARQRALAVPLRIAHVCGDVVTLALAMEPKVTGSVHFDVAAARDLSRAAALAALDLVEANLSAEQGADARARLAQDVAGLRARLG